MTYIKLNPDNTVNQYPYSINLLKRDNPNSSFPSALSDERLAEFNVYPVEEVTKPAFDPITQKAEELTPVLIDNIWTQQWQVANKFDTLEDMKSAKSESIKRSANTERNSGFTSDALGTTHEYGSTLEDRINLIGANKSNRPTKYNAKENGQKVRKQHTVQQMNQVLADGFTAIQIINDKEGLLLTQIDAATTVEELDAIVW